MLDVLKRISIGISILGVITGIILLLIWINPLLLLGIPVTFITLGASWLIGDCVLAFLEDGEYENDYLPD